MTCTQINERLICVRTGVSLNRDFTLEAMVKNRFGHQLDKDPEIRLNYGELRNVPLHMWNDRQRLYPIDDSVWGYKVHVDQGDEPGPDRWNRVRTDFALVLAGAWGFRTDLPRVYRLKAAYERSLVDTIHKLSVGIPLPTGKAWAALKEDPDALHQALLRAPLIRPKTDKGVRKWSRTPAAARTRLEDVLRSQGLEPRMTAGGESEDSEEQVSIDAEACRESGDPTLKAYADYTSIQKRLGYDIKALMAGEVHPGYIALQSNGRTASRGPNKRDKSPLLAYNAQNIPKKGGERECIVPRPGYKFLIVDYPSLEMRTWAQVCLETIEFSTLADFLNDPTKDPHSHLAARIAGVSYETVMANKKKYKDARDNAKRGNYGYMADMGAPRMVATCRKDDITLAPGGYDAEIAEAWRLKNLWKSTWPEAQPYFDYVKSLGNPCDITQFVTGRERGMCSYTDAANGFFSGLANDLAQGILFTISRECYDPSQGSILYGCRVVLFPHDEYVIEVPDDDGLHERATHLKRLCDEGSKKYTEDIIVSTEPCIANRYSKSAEAVYDASGRLIPWDTEETS